MRNFGFWSPASQAGSFLLKLFLSFEHDSFISGNVCVTEIVPSETNRPQFTQIMPASKALRPALSKCNAYKNVVAL